MLLSDYNYTLPSELIAQTPLAQRENSKLMILDRKTQTIAHSYFSHLIDYLNPGDVLVLNNTKVIKARLLGKRATGGQVECFLIEQVSPLEWKALLSPSSRLKIGEIITIAPQVQFCLKIKHMEEGLHLIEFQSTYSSTEILDQFGLIPLPPYIQQPLSDPNEWEDRYQTVYAQVPGAVAAPTAGLHMTPLLLEQLKKKGIQITAITLHVGLGTFLPVHTDRVEDHKMHKEFFHLSEETADMLNQARLENRSVIALGTTVARTLETVFKEGRYEPGSGYTDIFIYPGYEIHSIQGLITNFHLPKSTLLLLVSAFCGKDFIFKAYKTAIQEHYRFFSFGDAMFIF